MNVRKLLVVSLCFLLVFSLGLTTIGEVQAASKTATLKEIKGEVMVKRGGGKKEIKAFEGMGVTQGDSVRTGKSSSVKISLDDKNETLLGADTQILISELMGNNTSIKQSSGGVWNKVKGTMNAGDGYEVETPTSIMGVRGTLFMVQVGGDGRTNLNVLDGIVGMNRPNSGPSSPEQAVNVDEQVSTGPGSTIPTPSPLDIPQFVQETDVAILVQIILDELESSMNREQRAAEYERLYQSLNLPDHLTDAVEEAHLASLLAHIAEAIMREIEQSTRYQEVEQAFRDQGISWEKTYREVRNSVERAERKKAEIERIAERDKIRQDRQEQLRRELQDKIDRHRSGQSTSPSPTSPATPPSSGGGGGGGSTPSEPVGEKVTATFQNGWAVASGKFNGIDYTISIPQQSGDGNTISFTLQNPPSGIIPAGAGPIHALDITGLDGREVELTMNIPEGLSHQPQAYHHEGNGRWEPRGTEPNADGETVTFVTELSAVAVATKIPTPILEVDATPINNAQQYSVQLAWSNIEMEGIEGVGYTLYRRSETNPNPVEIWSTTDYTDNLYTDTVEAGETYLYTIKVVRAGFESIPSSVSVYTDPTVGRVTGEVTKLNSQDNQPLSGIKIKVWDADRVQVVANGTTDSAGLYSIPVPAGGPYRITAEYIEEPGHAYEIYNYDWAVADLFLKYYQVDNSDPYTFSVAESADTSIPEFSIVPYEKIENLIAEVSDHHFQVTWDPYPGAAHHSVFINGNVYQSANGGYTTSAQAETTYDFGVAAWESDYPLAIGLIEFTTDPIPARGTVTGAVYSTEDGYLANIPIKVWNQERTALIDGVVTDGNGQFEIPYVPVSENYRLTAEYQGQAYELFEHGQGEYIALSAFSVPSPDEADVPYTFSVQEDVTTDVGEIFIEYDSMFSPFAQIENLRITEETRETITVAWDPYQASSGSYRVLVNGNEVGYVNVNDPAPRFTIEATNGDWNWDDDGKWVLAPATYYEIAVGLWENGADGATAVATIFARTSLAWQ